MRKVVDSNYLQSPLLEAYLSRSSQNIVVLTDYAAMEAYKAASSEMIYRSMEILAKHPLQVVVLKGTQTICGLHPRRAGLQRRMIDKDQTRNFANFCRDLVRARRGDRSLQVAIEAMQREARAHMDRVLSDVADLPRVFDELAKIFTEAELKLLRTGKPYTEALMKKIIGGIQLFAGVLFRDHPRVQRWPTANELAYTYILRFSLCTYFLALKAIEVGGVAQMKPERMRNDLVDASFAAYATFFDGLLTSDAKLAEIYIRAQVFLARIT
jgi:hypothetical protein